MKIFFLLYGFVMKMYLVFVCVGGFVFVNGYGELVVWVWIWYFFLNWFKFKSLIFIYSNLCLFCLLDKNNVRNMGICYDYCIKDNGIRMM